MKIPRRRIEGQAPDVAEAASSEVDIGSDSGVEVAVGARLDANETRDARIEDVDDSARRIDGQPLRRRVPALRTAYPRASKVFADPAQGLASVEALYAALWILGQPRPELLEGYRWRAEFLALNPDLAP